MAKDVFLKPENKMATRNFCGFGLGPIQAGLFLWEAQESGNYQRLTVIELNRDLVHRIRIQGGRIALNIATAEGIRAIEIIDLEVLHPEDDFDTVIERISEADELATAIPSVEAYSQGGAFSVASLLARGLDDLKQRVVLTAENNNSAAKILDSHVRMLHPGLPRVQFLDTVIGKMSGVAAGSENILQLGLKPLLPGEDKAFLVESFNHIMVSRILLPGFSLGTPIFQEKSDLLPFEEAKLFGHNCIHAWLAYAGLHKNLRTMEQVGRDIGLMTRARFAFLEECGRGLLHRYGSMGDPLFTPIGVEAYADDLLKRMVNPFLLDSLERVGRDPGRKLGRGDRLIGAAKLVLEAGCEPVELIRGIRYGIEYFWKQKFPNSSSILSYSHVLRDIWGGEPTDAQEERILAML